jgi:hypothetical protein
MYTNTLCQYVRLCTLHNTFKRVYTNTLCQYVRLYTLHKYIQACVHKHSISVCTPLHTAYIRRYTQILGEIISHTILPSIGFDCILEVQQRTDEFQVMVAAQVACFLDSVYQCTVEIRVSY